MNSNYFLIIIWRPLDIRFSHKNKSVLECIKDYTHLSIHSHQCVYPIDLYYINFVIFLCSFFASIFFILELWSRDQLILLLFSFCCFFYGNFDNHILRPLLLSSRQGTNDSCLFRWLDEFANRTTSELSPWSGIPHSYWSVISPPKGRASWRYVTTCFLYIVYVNTLYKW